jgi:hypothetical protein
MLQSGCTARSVPQQWANHHEWQGRNNQTFHTLSIAVMTATCIFFTLYCKEQRQRMMVDCGEGMQDRAMQQPTNYLCCIARERAMIVKAQRALNEIHCNDDNVNNARIIFSCHIARSDDNKQWMQGKDKCNSHATIKYYMLSFAGCNNDHIAPCYDQLHEYAKGGYGKYAGDGVYITKGKYIE